MSTVRSMRNGLVGSAAVALIAGVCAWPAAAQTTTTPTDNGANCATGTSQQNCINNQNNTSTQPGAVTEPSPGTTNNSVGGQPGTTPPPSNSGPTNSTGGAVGPSSGTTTGGGSGSSSGSSGTSN